MRNCYCIVLILVATSGCTAISDLGRFRDYKTLTLELSGFAPHVNELIDVRLVGLSGEGTAPVVSGYARIDPLPTADYRFQLAHTLDPLLGHRLDFFADHDTTHDRMYDPPTAGGTYSDHTWRVPVPADGTITFVHNTNFVDIDTDPPIPLGSMTLHLTQADDWMGLPLDVNVVNAIGQQVGFYHLGMVAAADVDLELPEFVDDGGSYTIELVPGNGTHCTTPATATSNLVVDVALPTLDCAPVTAAH